MDLKPCPFCGADSDMMGWYVHYELYVDDMGFRKFTPHPRAVVECTCGARVEIPFENRASGAYVEAQKKAMEVWNRRHGDGA